MRAARHFLCVLCTLGAAALGDAADAQRLPQLTDGHPSFEGFWASQIQPFAVERVEGAKSLVVSDAEAAALAQAALKRRLDTVRIVDPNSNFHDADQLPRVRGEWRTSVVVEPPTGIAPMTAAARKFQADAARENLSASAGDGELRLFAERCIRGHATAPLGIVPAMIVRQIIQTPTHFVINNETDVGEARIVRLGASHPKPAVPSILGDSIGRWEGDELVVETTNVVAQHPERFPGVIVQPSARVIERFKLIAPDEILYRYTIEDPATYEGPWMGEHSLYRTSAPMFETACHEGNDSLVAILKIGRTAQERREKQSPDPTLPGKTQISARRR